MTQSFRLPSGGRIDRSKPVEFEFNGQHYEGYSGDTLASALLANGVRVVARSFKYHRPRGVMAAGAEEPNALVQVGSGARTIPNLRATQIEIVDGMQAASVNCWPSVDTDIGTVTGAVARMLPAGFYYKTFMWPPQMWMKYEHFIRKAAGFGTAPTAPDPDRYDKINAHCDVLVVGAGPAGLAAALSAAASGARVIVADEQNEFGGSLLHSRTPLDGAPAIEWVDKTLPALRASNEVTLLPRSTVYGYFDHNFLTIAERVTDHLATASSHIPRERLWRVRAKRVVLATGAIERPLVFANNDRPGVMLASAVSRYINRYAVAPATRAVVFTNNDSAYATALDLADAGVPVSVVDARANPGDYYADALKQRGIEVVSGCVVTNVRGTKRIGVVEIGRLNAAGDAVAAASGSLGCDLLAVSGGWSPAVHLHAQSGARPRFDDAAACFVPGDSVQAECSVGASNGAISLRDCFAQGFSGGVAAVQTAGRPSAVPPNMPEFDEPAEAPMQPLWLVPSLILPGRGPKQFVDYQNDTTAADIQLAAREGYRSIEHVKRYTALGFGTDQGKLGNINGMAILAASLGNSIAETGTTTFRPAYTPVTFGTIAGRDLGAERFDPVRKTAMHRWHVEHGAEFENVGQWKRPWYYPQAGEDIDAAVSRECLATRNGIGILDASTLGKIDVYGPDAAEFLNRIYTNAWSKLEVGRCRYGLMLGEDGMVMDDGVSARIGEHQYYMTTTTGGAAHVMGWMERLLQTEWPALKVYLTSVTDQWAVMSIAGPDSRSLISGLCDDIDFTSSAFPFMSFRNGTVAGVPARVFRISFSGELAFEINVPANFGRYVWDRVMAAGQSFGITPYGTEAMHVLRAEKGYVIVGQDTDGSVTPIDLGMDWIVSTNKDFIGKRSLSRSDCMRNNRKQLVGLLTEDPAQVLPEGAQLVNEPSDQYPVPMVGHVTSSYYSACLGRSIALAVVKGGRSRMQGKVYAALLDGRTLSATITDPVFYDAEGARQDV